MSDYPETTESSGVHHVVDFSESQRLLHVNGLPLHGLAAMILECPRFQIQPTCGL